MHRLSTVREARRLALVILTLLGLMGSTFLHQPVVPSVSYAAALTERVSHSVNGNMETWRIDEPNVRQRITDYQQVRFRPGDRVTVQAGGCAQTGGAGATWKRYVDPQGPNSNRLYHGLIWIPGVMGGLAVPGAPPSPVRIVRVIGHSFTVPGNIDSRQLYLRLGYEDDDYGDNGYWGHDDGTGNQCRGVGPAFVTITIVHGPPGAPPPPPPRPSSAPFDLSWDNVDDNGIPLNPKWSWQVTHPGSFPDPVHQCNKRPYAAPCTTQATSLDSGAFCGPHANWAAGTYEGTISWESHSCSLCDDDYNLRLVPPAGAGLTTVSGGSLELEFDSDETIDNFHTGWWNSFHRAVDSSDDAARRMVNGRFAIVSGLVGLDCEHSCHTELHPVWAMAIRVRDDPADEVWALFVRLWGNEGFCGSNQHYLTDLPGNRFTFRLPWRPGASAISVRRSPRDLLTRFGQVSGPDVTWAVNQGVLVSFAMPAPQVDEWIYGELHLQWTGSQMRPPQATAMVALSGLGRPPDREEKAESRLNALLGRMTPAQREILRSRLPQKTVAVDEAEPRQAAAAIRVQTLPAKPSQRPRVQAVPDSQKRNADQRRLEVLRTVFGNNIPGFPNASR